MQSVNIFSLKSPKTVVVLVVLIVISEKTSNNAIRICLFEEGARYT